MAETIEPVSILLTLLLFFILTLFDFYQLFMNDRRLLFCVQHGVDLSVVNNASNFLYSE